MKKKYSAFTLAEVLITLGIIGIVAAMTMPALIGKYKRSVVEARLKKFYTVINQTLTQSRAENSEISFENQNLESSNNIEYIALWFQKNITKYIKIIKEEGVDSSNQYYRVILLDGSSFSSYLSISGALYIFYCMDYKDCRYGNFDGKNGFLFRYIPSKNTVIPEYTGWKQDDLKNNCYYGERHGCAALIQSNGWKIPDDYPWIK